MLYTILKFIHILAAVSAIGGSTSYSIWLAQARMKPETLLFALRSILIIDTRIGLGSYVLLLITGIGAAQVGGISLGTPWISLSFALLLIALLLGRLVQAPAARTLIALIEAGKFGAPEHIALSKRMRGMGMFLSLFSLAIFYLMVFKPVLW